VSRVFHNFLANGGQVQMFASCTACPAGEETGFLASDADEETNQAEVGVVWPNRFICLDCGAPIQLVPNLDAASRLGDELRSMATKAREKPSRYLQLLVDRLP
jgi:hypothetical protein